MEDGQDRSTGEQFIDLYNKLDAYLRRALAVDRSVPFMTVARQAAHTQKHTAVRMHLEQIQSFHELRCAIIHDSMSYRGIIADPRKDVVDEFRSVVLSITAPKRLLTVACRDITVFAPDDPLVRALALMHSRDYSQVVVGSGVEYGILSTEGVARWLEDQVEQDIISVADATVADAIEHEPPSTAEFMDQSVTIYDGYEVFRRMVEGSHARVFAILITHSGRNTERLLGIVTPWNLFGLFNPGR